MGVGSTNYLFFKSNKDLNENILKENHPLTLTQCQFVANITSRQKTNRSTRNDSFSSEQLKAKH